MSNHYEPKEIYPPKQTSWEIQNHQGEVQELNNMAIRTFRLGKDHAFWYAIKEVIQYLEATDLNYGLALELLIKDNAPIWALSDVQESPAPLVVTNHVGLTHLLSHSRTTAASQMLEILGQLIALELKVHENAKPQPATPAPLSVNTLELHNAGPAFSAQAAVDYCTATEYIRLTTRKGQDIDWLKANSYWVEVDTYAKFVKDGHDPRLMFEEYRYKDDPETGERRYFKVRTYEHSILTSIIPNYISYRGIPHRLRTGNFDNPIREET